MLSTLGKPIAPEDLCLPQNGRLRPNWRLNCGYTRHSEGRTVGFGPVAHLRRSPAGSFGV